MPMRYVLDEHLRGRFWRAFVQHNRGGVDPVDVVRVGDPADLPLSTLDPDLLLWAAREDCLVVTMDPNTMPGHLADLLTQGGDSPGVLLLRPGYPLAVLVFNLVYIAHAEDPADYRNQARFVP